MTDIRIRLNQINADSIATSVFAARTDVNTVQDNVAALDNNVWVNSNDFTTYSTVTANIYDTYTAVQANLNSVSSNVDNTVANVYNTYNTLKTDIDLVSSNLTSVANVYSEKFDVDGSTNAFTLARTINSEEELLVYLDGVLQHSDSYVISGTTLTISNTLPIPVSTLGLRSLSALATSAGGEGAVGSSYLKTFALG
jgi:hypothetical protein